MTAYEFDRAEFSLCCDFKELTRSQQAVLAYATLHCLHSNSGWVEISYVAYGLGMPEDAVRTVLDELHALGLAYATGHQLGDLRWMVTRLAEDLFPIAIGAGGRPSPKEWARLRALMLERYEGEPPCCIYCATTDVSLAVDHLVPVSRGGSNHIENLAFACTPCNSAKRDKTYSEFMEARRGEA